jgi:hypothetical protein
MTKAAETYYQNLITVHFTEVLDRVGNQFDEAMESDLVMSDDPAVAQSAFFRVSFLAELFHAYERMYVEMTDAMKRHVAENRMLEDLCPWCASPEMLWADTQEGEAAYPGSRCRSCGWDSDCDMSPGKVKL